MFHLWNHWSLCIYLLQKMLLSIYLYLKHWKCLLVRKILLSVATGVSKYMSSHHWRWLTYYIYSLHFYSDYADMTVSLLWREVSFNYDVKYSCKFQLTVWIQTSLHKWRKSHSLDFYSFNFYESVSPWLVVQSLQWHWHPHIGAINASSSCSLGKSHLLEIFFLFAMGCACNAKIEKP